jgi:RNA polymerase sigma factor (sigma-70 family)
VQTAFFYILISKTELRWNSDAEMFSYVKTVVQNIWLSQNSARARRLIEVPLEDDGQGSSTKPSMDRRPEFGRSANIEEELLRTEQRELLAQQIAGLSKIYRESLTMYLSGVPTTEIASQLGLPESTVWTRINRAKDMLMQPSQKKI